MVFDFDVDKFLCFVWGFLLEGGWCWGGIVIFFFICLWGFVFNCFLLYEDFLVDIFVFDVFVWFLGFVKENWVICVLCLGCLFKYLKYF